MWAPPQIGGTHSFPGKLLYYSLKQLKGTKIKFNEKPRQILVNIRATLSILNPSQNLQMGSWKNWQKPTKGENSYQIQLSQLSVCSTGQRGEIKISFAPSLGTPLKSKGLFSTVRSIYCVSWLTATKQLCSRSKIGPIAEPDKNLFLGFLPKAKMKLCIQRERKNLLRALKKSLLKKIVQLNWWINPWCL